MSQDDLPVPAQMPATVKLLKFAQYYLESGSAIEAARKAGYQAPSEAALSALAHRLLQRDDISMYVGTHLKSLISAEEAGAILSDICRCSPEHFIKLKEDGSFEWDFSTPQAQSHMHLIKGMKPGKYGLTVEFHDKIRALELLTQYVKFEDPKTLQRRMVQSLMEKLTPEQRATVMTALDNEGVPMVIEGERGEAPEKEVDLSFLRAGMGVIEATNVGDEPAPDPEDDDAF